MILPPSTAFRYSDHTYKTAYCLNFLNSLIDHVQFRRLSFGFPRSVSSESVPTFALGFCGLTKSETVNLHLLQNHLESSELVSTFALGFCGLTKSETINLHLFQNHLETSHFTDRFA